MDIGIKRSEYPKQKFPVFYSLIFLFQGCHLDLESRLKINSVTVNNQISANIVKSSSGRFERADVKL